MNPPIVIAFLLADKVFREMETGKVHVAGTFNQLATTKFPMVHPQFFVYLAMTEVPAGTKNLGMSFQFIETGEKILEVKQPVTSRSPLDVIEVNMCFNAVNFSQEGNVELTLSFDDKDLMTRVLRVRKVEPPKHPGAPPATP